MVVDAQIVELGVCEKMILEQTGWERRVWMPTCHADEWDQWGLDVLESVFVWLIDRLGVRDCDMVLRRWVLDLLPYSCEGVDRDTVEDGRGRG